MVRKKAIFFRLMTTLISNYHVQGLLTTFDGLLSTSFHAGPHTNAQQLLSYGFVSEDNPHNIFSFTFDVNLFMVCACLFKSLYASCVRV